METASTHKTGHSDGISIHTTNTSSTRHAPTRSCTSSSTNSTAGDPIPDRKSSASSSQTAAAVDPTTVTFVDYRRPPSVKVRPPSKYKLWLMVFVLVYLAVWAAEAARLRQALRLGGWLSPDGAQFLQLAITVFVLVFGALDFAVAVCVIKCKGKEYGLGPWIKCGTRVQWIHQTKYSDYFIMECVKGSVLILEEGFAMFNATAIAPAAPSKHISEMSRTSPERQSAEGGTRHTLGEQDLVDYHDIDNSSHNSDYNEEVPFTCQSDSCKAMIKIEHRVNPDKMAEYQKWKVRIHRASASAPGLISINNLDIVEEEIADPSEKVVDEKEDVEKGLQDDDGCKEVATTSTTKVPAAIIRRIPTFRHLHTTGHSTTTKLHTVYLTFDNIDNLNDWMMSPRRKALMKQLEPLLVVPDQELIQAEHAAGARDAFTNLTIQQGQNCPILPPKKWKVWWLTTVALVITIRWATSFLAYYLEFWGLNEVHPRLRMLVVLFVVTFMNSYVTTPFLLFLFHPWLIRRSNEIDERFVWKTLNDGIQSMWLKFLLTFVFYGGCVLAWIAQSYSRW
jgi:antibiotic biosynthesis monooxygenase (ABM) superfamily enzyme